jgi:hypothetical protein
VRCTKDVNNWWATQSSDPSTPTLPTTGTPIITLTPINGVCSDETYTCLSGSMSQRPDIDGKKNWLCMGINSWTSVQCTKDVNNWWETITLPTTNTQNPLLTFPQLTDPNCLGTRPENSVVLQPGNVNTAARNWEYKVAIMWPMIYNTCTFTCKQWTVYNATANTCSTPTPTASTTPIAPSCPAGSTGTHPNCVCPEEGTFFHSWRNACIPEGDDNL